MMLCEWLVRVLEGRCFYFILEECYCVIMYLSFFVEFIMWFDYEIGVK